MGLEKKEWAIHSCPYYELMKAAAPNELLVYYKPSTAAVLKVGATLPAAVEKQTFLVVPPA